MFKNYCLLNPLNSIFNFSSTPENTLKRKSASDLNICPRKQRVFMPLGYPRQGDDDNDDAKNSVSAQTLCSSIPEESSCKSINNLGSNNGSFQVTTTPANSMICMRIEFSDYRDVGEKEIDSLNHELKESFSDTEKQNFKIKKTKRRNCEYLLAKQYSKLNETNLPKIKIKTSNDFHNRAHQTFQQHCINVFDEEAQIECNMNSIEEIWSKMSLCRKFPYYWLAANCSQLSKNAFENFINFYNKLPKHHAKTVNIQKLLNIWKDMTYDEKLPFIFETFLVHISGSPKLLREHNMKIFFDVEKRKR